MGLLSCKELLSQRKNRTGFEGAASSVCLSRIISWWLLQSWSWVLGWSKIKNSDGVSFKVHTGKQTIPKSYGNEGGDIGIRNAAWVNIRKAEDWRNGHCRPHLKTLSSYHMFHGESAEILRRFWKGSQLKSQLWVPLGAWKVLWPHVLHVTATNF